MLNGELIQFGTYYYMTEEENRPDDSVRTLGLAHLADRLYTDGFKPGAPRRVVLPEQFYLWEIGGLRLDDPEEVLRFTQKWGVLGEPGLSEIAIPMFDTELLDPSRKPAHLAHLDLFKEMGNLVAHHLRPGEQWDFRKFVHVREIAVHAALIRDLTRVWDAVSGGGSLEAVRRDWESHWLQPPPTTELAQGFLVDMLSHALRPFHVQLFLTRNGRITYGRWSPTLFAATCLQLANDIAQEQPYRRCLKCGRLFVSQRGRAKYGQFRKEGDIKYCSSACAKAQAQRDLYRRQVNARKLHAQGLDAEDIAERLSANLESVRRWIGKGEAE
ncbi:MAG: hypothetical protein M5U22_20570 [Thermoleophilia bacterium]|nr:hypothetical protein [Thermoleophilia bacterium]